MSGVHSTVGSATHPNDAPDWAAQLEEIHCPLCQYNLRGLSEPRCPECGHRFNWTQLLSEPGRQHPFLFELHPEQNVNSYLHTFAAALSPARFFTSIYPSLPLRLDRLLLYWLPTAFVATTVVLSAVFVAAFEVFLRGRGSFKRALRQDEFLFTVLLASIYMLWPWMAAGVMMVFRTSMRRAKISRGHLLRCTIYSADLGVPLAALLLAFVITMLLAVAGGAGRFDPEMMGVLFVLGMLLIVSYRFWRAYRDYLRMDHGLAVVASVQVILFLFSAIMLQAFYDSLR